MLNDDAGLLQLYNLALFSHNRFLFHREKKDRAVGFFSTAYYYEILIGQIVLFVLFAIFVFYFRFLFGFIKLDFID